MLPTFFTTRIGAPPSRGQRRAVPSRSSDATNCPSGLNNARSIGASESVERSVASSRPVPVDQMRAAPSPPAVTSMRPSGLNETELTVPSRTLRTRPASPVSTSRMRAVPSSLALARSVPSGLKATPPTRPSCPSKVLRRRPFATFQRRTPWSKLACGEEVSCGVEGERGHEARAAHEGRDASRGSRVPDLDLVGPAGRRDERSMELTATGSSRGTLFEREVVRRTARRREPRGCHNCAPCLSQPHVATRSPLGEKLAAGLSSNAGVGPHRIADPTGVGGVGARRPGYGSGKSTGLLKRGGRGGSSATRAPLRTSQTRATGRVALRPTPTSSAPSGLNAPPPSVPATTAAGRNRGYIPDHGAAAALGGESKAGRVEHGDVASRAAPSASCCFAVLKTRVAPFPGVKTRSRASALEA